MSEQTHKAAVITALGAIIAALIGAFAAVYVHETRKTDNTGTKTSGPGIYLHFANDGQRALAYQIKSKLEAKGYYVPTVRSANAGFRRTKVKYFPNSKESGADNLVSLLHSWGVVDAEKVSMDGYLTEPQHYEIWFGQIASNTNSP